MKIGDKGITRDGRSYEVVKKWLGREDMMVVRIDDADYVYPDHGRYDSTGFNPWDLMLPDWTLRRFQEETSQALVQCFGEAPPADVPGRRRRLLEEALEAQQAAGGDRLEAHRLVDYVHGRPVGDPAQEIGGVALTLSGLASALRVNLQEAAMVELARFNFNMEAIRAKRRPKFEETS